VPLSDQFTTAARNALLELYPVHASIAPRDYRRVLRPTGPGAHSISIEPYRGSSTWIAFIRALETSTVFAELKTVIADSQPELSYHLVLPGRAMSLEDCNALVITWCSALDLDPTAQISLPKAIDVLLENLARLLDEKTLTHRAITSLAGVRLVGIDVPIQVDLGVTFRPLSESEVIELGAQDITFGQPHDLLSHSVSCCIDFQSPCGFTLEPTHPQTLVVSDVIQEATNRTTNILRALHVLKPGRAGVFLTQTEFLPKLLPFLGGSSSWPLNRPAFASLELLASEVAQFLQLERALLNATRQELRIAADRLVDAENRLSPVDALLDAVIGLEVVLNPMDSSELAFRVALNYAFLAPPEHRRERYDRVRLLQKTRNRVVHGGLNLQSADAATIHEHASLAKACLRDVLQSFLLDDSLKGNKKLDADFWLDRVIPVVVLEQSLALPNSE
jgi:predicted nuclease with RNAse H fold